jgi:hypothetical protein
MPYGWTPAAIVVMAKVISMNFLGRFMASYGKQGLSMPKRLLKQRYCQCLNIQDDMVGLPRTPQLRVNYLTGGIYEQETEIQQRIQA